MANVINGGAHSDVPIDFKGFMIMPLGLPTFSEGPRAIVETFHAPKACSKTRAHHCYGPRLTSEAPKTQSRRLLQAFKNAGHRPGKDINLKLDPAASEFCAGNGKYTFKKSTGETITGDELVSLYVELVKKYPIVSIEGGRAEKDWATWKKLTDKLGDKVQLVGDDLFVPNVKFLGKDIEQGVANAILTKANQIGSLPETLDCMELAKTNAYRCTIGHRSGETEDSIIA